MQRGPDRPHALWAIPLTAGLLPAAAVLVALNLSIRLELIPACNPLIEGCVSISASARHGLPNYIFRALVLPAAALQALSWILSAGWLRELGARPDRLLRALPWLGLFAGLFLVLYGTFLGTEGQVYRWMRRYGVVFYFGLTCICMVITAGHLFGAARGPTPAPKRFGSALVGLCMVLVGLGLASAFSPLFIAADEARNRVGNVLEWNGALIFTLFFLSLAWLWRATGFRATLSTERETNSQRGR